MHARRMFCVALLGMLMFAGCTPAQQDAPGATPAPPAAAAGGQPGPSTLSTLPGFEPARVVIPAIDVDAKVVPLGLGSRGELDVSPLDRSPDDVGWWSGGTPPGAIGPAVLAGHVDYDGLRVFARLSELKPGDRIQVLSQQSFAFDYTVTRLEQVGKNSFPTKSVYGETSEPAIRLITCGGRFDSTSGHYESNVIVYGKAA